jgi:hypothetical protein
VTTSAGILSVRLAGNVGCTASLDQAIRASDIDVPDIDVPNIDVPHIDVRGISPTLAHALRANLHDPVDVLVVFGSPSTDWSSLADELTHTSATATLAHIEGGRTAHVAAACVVVDAVTTDRSTIPTAIRAAAKGNWFVHVRTDVCAGGRPRQDSNLRPTD